MRIIDFFIFYNELDLLELRLTELFDVVDEFVIVESKYSFTNKYKGFIFLENMARFEKFLSKVRYLTIDTFPQDINLYNNNSHPSYIKLVENRTIEWSREVYQRNFASNFLKCYSKNDWLIISDLDEIPNKKSILELRNLSCENALFQQRFSYFYMNYVEKSGLFGRTIFSTAVRIKELFPYDIDEIRWNNRTQKAKKYEYDKETKDIALIKNAGWHFSYLGDENTLINKLQNFSHQELNIDKYTSRTIIDIIKNKGDLFDRSNHTWEIIDMDGDVPIAVIQNPQKYSKYILSNKEIL